MIKEILVNKNILNSDDDAIVIPVNTAGAMGAGLAKDCRDMYPAVYYFYKKICRQKVMTHTTLLIYKSIKFKYKIVLAPTKRHWKDPSRIDDVEATIKALAEWCVKWNITSISIPLLGCGKGGLSFDEKVRPLMVKYLTNIPTSVTICSMN